MSKNPPTQTNRGPMPGGRGMGLDDRPKNFKKS